MSGQAIVYTETVVHSAPERFVSEAPYQIAIVDTQDAGRQTVRIVGDDRVEVGDRVRFVETRDGIHCYQKQS